jgi:uncharacterized protein (TIGR02246 family)
MKPLLLTILIGIGSLSITSFGEDDLSKLENSARNLIAAFNAGDAEALSSLFVEGGELLLASGEIILGREDLLAHYTEVFADDARPQAALEAGSVRFLTATLAVEDGTVHITSPDGEISSRYYQAVHVKQEDGNWLFASIRDEEGDHALPAEKLIALQWLIGDWIIQADGTDTWISFSWSDDGPYIDAKALTESPDSMDTAATLRIGWNEKEETFVSWGFDAEGGFNQSTWYADGPERWVLKTSGVTASGETNIATQVLDLDDSAQSFTWSKRDQILNGVIQPDRTLNAVKRPPQPMAATADSAPSDAE